ncbi:Single-stranded DNA-binding protein 2 [Anabarilius grahami]|uniref:Single-stranded DNA-binding protein 2 n=1 Tax=Anabarilius grahami TaxID=495550 RepID=A0A3N0XT97_ANAGA|nr:Single-stranded DNA-binding protein 2 [Anabarilius grahami]
MFNLLRFDPWQWVYYWVRQPLWRARLPGPGSPTPLRQTKGPDGGAKTCPVPPLKPFHQPLSLLLSFVPVKDPKHRLTLCIPFPFVGKCLNPPLAQFEYILLRWGWPRDKLEGRRGVKTAHRVFWDLYCAAPDRRETCEHSSEAKAFHDYSICVYGDDSSDTAARVTPTSGRTQISFANIALACVKTKPLI